MVMDVAPSNSSEDGHTVAYAIDIARGEVLIRCSTFTLHLLKLTWPRRP